MMTADLLAAAWLLVQEVPGQCGWERWTIAVLLGVLLGMPIRPRWMPRRDEGDGQ